MCSLHKPAQKAGNEIKYVEILTKLMMHFYPVPENYNFAKIRE